jgi:hypothetical protein
MQVDEAVALLWLLDLVFQIFLVMMRLAWLPALSLKPAAEHWAGLADPGADAASELPDLLFSITAESKEFK